MAMRNGVELVIRRPAVRQPPRDIVDGEAEFLEQLASGGRSGGHAHNAAVQANILVPVVGDAGFDGDTVGDFQRHLLLVLGALGVEHVGGRMETTRTALPCSRNLAAVS